MPDTLSQATAKIVKANRSGGPEGVIDEVEKEEPAGFDDVNEVLSSYRRARIIATATGQWPVSSEGLPKT